MTECEPCLTNDDKRCIVCHCRTPDMFYSPHKADAKGKWGQILDRQAIQYLELSLNYQHMNPPFPEYDDHLKDRGWTKEALLSLLTFLKENGYDPLERF